jgi:hypothetical protein
MTGVLGRTVKLTVAVPPAVVTTMLRLPTVAAPLIVKMVVADEPPMDASGVLATIPAPASTETPDIKLAPTKVTGMAAPAEPMFGLMLLMLGGCAA